MAIRINHDLSHIDSLIDNLKTLEGIESLRIYKGVFLCNEEVGTLIDDSDINQLIDVIETQTTRLLITLLGQPCQIGIGQLVKAGFAVKPGEKDSFGWLTGIVVTQVGNILFG